MADRKHGELYVAKQHGQDIGKIGYTEAGVKHREPRLLADGTIEQTVETPECKKWEKAILHLIEIHEIHKRGTGNATEWLKIGPQRLIPILELIEAEVCRGQEEVLRRINGGERPSAIAADLDKRRTERKHSVRALKKKGLLPPNAEKMLPKGLLPEIVAAKFNSLPETEAADSPVVSEQVPKPNGVLPGKTPQAEFCELIVDVLEEFGGSGWAKDVIAQIGERVQLRARDLERYDSGPLVWKANVRFAREQLKRDGILKSRSPDGLWELA